jgi:hypothetical protein
MDLFSYASPSLATVALSLPAGEIMSQLNVRPFDESTINGYYMNLPSRNTVRGEPLES